MDTICEMVDWVVGIFDLQGSNFGTVSTSANGAGQVPGTESILYGEDIGMGIRLDSLNAGMKRSLLAFPHGVGLRVTVIVRKFFSVLASSFRLAEKLAQQQKQGSNITKSSNCHCSHWLWGCAFLLLATSSHAGTNHPVRGTWFLSLDNDVIAQSDDDYTNGIQAGWASGYLESFLEGPVPSLVGKGLAKLPFVNRQGQQRFISHSLSHRIFTPSDTEIEEPIPGDMPYSGLLFATLTAGAQDANTMDAFSLHYGIAGPSARGEEVQNQFHKIIGSNDIKGWDNQIHDELLLNLGYEHRRRLLTFGDRQAWGGDMIGQAGASLGNLVSMVSLGVGARFGWHVPDDFGIPPQFFGEETIGSRPFSTHESQSGIWAVVLLNGSLFGNAIFWDGNTFKDSMSVDYDPAIARLYVGLQGFVGRWSGGASIATTTVPWENPDDRRSQMYGRLGIQYTY